jgi:hypothetical protein
VLVEMVATGLCHSDDHFATGDVTLRHVPMVGGQRARASSARWARRCATSKPAIT